MNEIVTALVVSPGLVVLIRSLRGDLASCVGGVAWWGQREGKWEGRGG